MAGRGAMNATTQPPDLAAAYQQVEDLLRDLYWQASEVSTKDQVFAAMEEVGEIIDQLDESGLQANSERFVALLPKIKAANKALDEIRINIQSITKKLSTTASVVAAINKVLSLVPAL